MLQNISVEGPGAIDDHLRIGNIPCTTIDLEQGQPLPDIPSYSHVIIMGGPMAVYEMDRTPYLKDEALFIEKAVKAGRHVLGVCLGAWVYPGGAKEIGWYDVTLTEEGMRVGCMAELAVDGGNIAQVFPWPGDTFDLPQEAVRLASSDLYPNQAFRYGDRVYALQLPIEVTPNIVHGRLRNEQGIDFPLIDKRSQKAYGPYRKRAEGFYRSFPRRPPARNSPSVIAPPACTLLFGGYYFRVI